MISNYLEVQAGQKDVKSPFFSLPHEVVSYIGFFCCDLIINQLAKNWLIDTTKPNTASNCELSCKKFTSFLPFCKLDKWMDHAHDIKEEFICEEEFINNRCLQENSIGDPFQIIEFIRERRLGKFSIEGGCHNRGVNHTYTIHYQVKKGGD